MQTVQIAGLGPIQLPDGIKFKQSLLPIGCNRPGILRNSPPYWVQHETDNERVGMGALAHEQWIHGLGCEEVSFTFLVDDEWIIQVAPTNEVLSLT